ncbi:hypothetical protein Tco_0265455 [Tanacetum coccineum]
MHYSKGKMDDPDITMEEYIWFKEEKARGHDFEEEFLVIVFKDVSMPKLEYPRKLIVSTLYTHEIDFDFKMSYKESDDEDYTFIFDENLFSYKLVPIDELNSDS